jgi:hypothetical protein
VRSGAVDRRSRRGNRPGDLRERRAQRCRGQETADCEPAAGFTARRTVGKLTRDTIPRKDTSLERLAKLPPSFLKEAALVRALASILTEYLRDSHVTVESKIATALFYGIAAETQDLGREATPADFAASHFLYPYANKRRLGKIENARVPREYFRTFRDAIEEAVVYDKVVISDLGDVLYPDMVAEVADFLLRLDEVDWALAMGCYKKNLHVSLRTTDRDANAGEILQKVLGSRSAGGHDMIAGGKIRPFTVLAFTPFQVAVISLFWADERRHVQNDIG